MIDSPYLSRSEVCRLLGVSSQQLSYWLKKCKIKTHRFGSSQETVIHKDAFRTLVAQFETRNGRIRCKHPRLVIIECKTTETTSVFIGGKLIGEPTRREKPTKTIHVYCEDCIFDNRYNPGRVPKWIQALRQQLPGS